MISRQPGATTACSVPPPRDEDAAMMPRTARSALANQVRLVLHTAAYWLLLTVRDVISRPHPLATAEFMRLACSMARHRDSDTRPRRLCRSVPGRGIVPWHRHQPPARRTITRGDRPLAHQIPPPNAPTNQTDIAMKPATRHRARCSYSTTSALCLTTYRALCRPETARGPCLDSGGTVRRLSGTPQGRDPRRADEAARGGALPAASDAASRNAVAELVDLQADDALGWRLYRTAVVRAAKSFLQASLNSTRKLILPWRAWSISSRTV